MNQYMYDGPVMEFDTCVANRWQGSTYAACHVLWELIYHKATISVHSHFYSHCRTDRSASKPETTFPHRLL